MAYRLKLRESPAAALRRIGAGELGRCRQRLKAAAAAPTRAAAIHDIRRALKRLRALLRLAEAHLGRAQAARQRRRIAAIARLLAPARDLHVMRETVSGLTRAGALSDAAGQALTSELDRAETPAARSTTRDPLGQAARELAKAAEEIGAAKGKGRRADILHGLGRAYRRCCRALGAAYAGASDDAFHELRKAVQVHWRHMQLVRRVWPAVIEARIETARDLSQILGEDHDLAMLKAFAAAASDDAVAARFRAEIIACCGDRQRSLRRQARPLANRLFAETPAAFTDRIEAYWRAARRLERLQLRAGRTPEPAADTPEEK